MKKAGRVFIGVLAWTMMLTGAAMAIGMSGLTVLSLVRGGGEALAQIKQGDYESIVWLIMGLVSAVVGGLIFWAGVSLCRLFDQMEARQP